MRAPLRGTEFSSPPPKAPKGTLSPPVPTNKETFWSEDVGEEFFSSFGGEENVVAAIS